MNISYTYTFDYKGINDIELNFNFSEDIINSPKVTVKIELPFDYDMLH